MATTRKGAAKGAKNKPVPAPRKKQAVQAKSKEKKQKKPAAQAEEPLAAELNERQKRFCEEYLIDLNGTQAYLRAGYEVSEKTASVNAARLLANAKVQAYTASLIAARSKRTSADADMVVEHWRQLATANPNELMEFRRGCCRYCWGKGFRFQRTQGEMERARQAHAERVDLHSSDPDKYPHPGLFDEQGGIGYHRKKPANPDCPECFGDGEGYTHFNDTRNLSPSAALLYAGVKQTERGLEIKTHSKEKAVEMLARHNGMLSEKLLLTTPKDEPIQHQHQVGVTPEAQAALERLGKRAQAL